MTDFDFVAAIAAAQTSLFGWSGWRDDASYAGVLCAFGVPMDHGNVISRGASRAPATIRHASSGSSAARDDGLDIGDIGTPNAPDAELVMDRIASVINQMQERGLCPLMLGGDHSITYAPVSALQQSRDMSLIWLDAHTDFSPWSGENFHNHKQVLRRISKLNGVRQIVQIGYRGITVGDERALGPGLKVVTTAHARKLNAQAVLDLVPEGLPCYISIDVDVIDPLDAPGTSAPVPDGLLPEQVKNILRTLVCHREIIGVDLVEVNPALDVRNETSQVAADLILCIVENWNHQRTLTKMSNTTDANLQTDRSGNMRLQTCKP